MASVRTPDDKRLLALITGASGGIGHAIARTLASAGYRLVLVARRRGPLEAVARELVAEGAEAIVVPTDITDPASVETMAQVVTERYPALDLLVNNAGIFGGELPFDQITPELWQRVLAVNLSGPYLCCHALLPLLRRAERPVVVNITSGAAVRTGFLNIAYGVSKAGLDRLTIGLAAELPDLICVSLSAPVTASDTVKRLYAERDIDQWAEPPLFTARALTILLRDPGRYDGQVISARELMTGSSPAPGS